MAPMNPIAKSSFFIRIQCVPALLGVVVGVLLLLDSDEFLCRNNSIHIQLNEVHTRRF